MKRIKNKKSSGRPISGSLKPIQKTIFYNNFETILHSAEIVDLELLNELRNEYKDIIAIYMRHASLIVGARKDISTEFISLYLNNLNYHEKGFIACAILYYNQYESDIIEVDLSSSKTGSRDCKKAFSQAKVNSEIIFNRMIKKIINKMQNGAWRNITQQHIIQYESIQNAVNFLVKFIPALHIKKLPSELSKDIYDQAIVLDETIKEFYCYETGQNNYKLKKKNKFSYSMLNFKCAAFLFCYKFYN